VPRVKPSASAPVWYGPVHVLSERARGELSTLLGFDSIRTAAKKKMVRSLSRIEYCLGYYHGAVLNVDQAPRAADYRAALKVLRKDAIGLLGKLRNENVWILTRLNVDRAKVSELETALVVFVDACTRTSSTTAVDASAGRRRNQAIVSVVTSLRRIFKEFYRGDASKTRSKRGAIIQRSPLEKIERQFITAALRDAHIREPDNLNDLLASSMPSMDAKSGT
jgi:hypothetical protein